MGSRKLIFIEGIWGSGKTSTIQNIQNALAAAGETSASISDEDASVTRLYPQIEGVALFLSHYQQAWDTLIAEKFHQGHVIFEGGLFTSLGQHWLEREMPILYLLEYIEDTWRSLTTEHVYVIHLTPKNIQKHWQQLTRERGSAWTRYLETQILCATNLRRTKKYSTIREYIQELDSLYRQIFVRLNKNTLQVETTEGGWHTNLHDMFSFLGLKSVNPTAHPEQELCGMYECEGKTCTVHHLGNCLQIRDIFGADELIMYLYSQEFPMIEDVHSDFSLPAFGTVKIRFLTEDNTLVFYVLEVFVENTHFEKHFRGLENTKWVKKAAA